MRIIFIEFYWQVLEILKNKEQFKNDLIISLHHEISYFLMTDQIGLKLLLKNKNIFQQHKTKRSAIFNGEYEISKCILTNGYSLDCMIPRYQNIDWRNKKKPTRLVGY